MNLPVKTNKLFLLLIILLVAASALLISLYFSYRKEVAELRIKACHIEGHPYATCERGWIVFEVIEAVTEPMSWEALVDNQKINEGTVEQETTVNIEWPNWVLETIGQAHVFKVIVDGWYEESLNFGGPECVSPTPTPSPTPSTETPTPTATIPTESPSPTPTSSPTETPTETPVSTPTPTSSPTSTPSQTPSSTPTSSPPPTGTPQPTSTPTPGPTGTPGPTDTPGPTNTPEPTGTPRPTSTSTPPDQPSSTPKPPTPTPILLPNAGSPLPTVWLTGLSVLFILIGLLL